MKTNRSELWEPIATAGEQVAHAYQEMVRAADELAKELGYNRDYVLRRVLPKTVGEHRKGERILAWLNTHRDGIEAELRARQAAQAAATQRAALLAKLNLTPDEQRLLGITGRLED